MADLLTTAQVAKLLGKSVPTINRWAAEGRLPYEQKLEGQRGAYLFDRKVINTARKAETTAAQRISA